MFLDSYSSMLKAAEHQKYNQIDQYFPDHGELARNHYPKHLDFFKATKDYREVLFLAANRSGKSLSGSFLVATCATGLYLDWWEGKQWNRKINICVAGDTAKTTRDILQTKLLGSPGALGTGMIPKSHIEKVLSKAGVPDAIEIAYIRNEFGGLSVIHFKSFDQGRIAFQGTEWDLIWLDEECKEEIYIETLMRTMTTDGLVITTFTPLNGLTSLVLQFCPGGDISYGAVDGSKTKYVITCSWDDSKHLSEKAKEELWASIPPFQRDARSKGIPQLGAGAIYPVPESDIVVPDIAIPDHWNKCFGMDVGWNRTAVLWAATDPATDTTYIYSEHYRGDAEPIIHAEAIKARGLWIPGVIDPASNGRGQKDGDRLLEIYLNMGLKLIKADNSVEAGIYKVWQRFSFGKLKIMASCVNTIREYRTYHRDEKGRIVKKDDHAMDALKYIVSSGLDIAKTNIVTNNFVGYHGKPKPTSSSWMMN